MVDKPSSRKNAPELDEHMGRYELVRPLGRGGMAEVFLARQTGLAGFTKQLVIKRVLPDLVDDAKFVEMFLDEARLAARLTHPNICQVFELGEVNGQYFIAMEHVPGVTLTHLVVESREKQVPMPLAAAFRIVAQLCEALAYAHQLVDEDGRSLNLVHRDVTPSNVMVTPEGSVKLLDFGIARAADRTHLTQVGVAKGKLGFMSPEQLKSPQDIDHRSDLFAVGALLYTLVVGKTPYAEVLKTPQGLREMAHGRFPPPREVAPWIPEAVEKLILRAMREDPDLRFLSALEFHRELEKVAMSLSLSLGPHALLDFMAELEREPDQRATRRLVRTVERVVNLGTGDVVATGEGEGPGDVGATGERERPQSRMLPAIVIGAGLAVLVVGGALVVKLSGSSPAPEEVPTAPPAPVVVVRVPPPEPPPERVAPEPVPEAVEEPPANPPQPPVEPPRVVAPPPRVVAKPPAVTGPSGTLIVEATPKARVLLGSQLLGTTPLNVKVAVGSHRLKVDYGTSSHQLIINVSEGKETTVRDRAD